MNYDTDAVEATCKALETLGEFVPRLRIQIDETDDYTKVKEFDAIFDELERKLGDDLVNPCHKHAFEQDFADRSERGAKRMRVEAALARLRVGLNVRP